MTPDRGRPRITFRAAGLAVGGGVGSRARPARPRPNAPPFATLLPPPPADSPLAMETPERVAVFGGGACSPAEDDHDDSDDRDDPEDFPWGTPEARAAFGRGPSAFLRGGGGGGGGGGGSGGEMRSRGGGDNSHGGDVATW